MTYIPNYTERYNECELFMTGFSLNLRTYIARSLASEHIMSICPGKNRHCRYSSRAESLEGSNIVETSVQPTRNDVVPTHQHLACLLDCTRPRRGTVCSRPMIWRRHLVVMYVFDLRSCRYPPWALGDR